MGAQPIYKAAPPARVQECWQGWKGPPPHVCRTLGESPSKRAPAVAGSCALEPRPLKGTSTRTRGHTGSLAEGLLLAPLSGRSQSFPSFSESKGKNGYDKNCTLVLRYQGSNGVLGLLPGKHTSPDVLEVRGGQAKAYGKDRCAGQAGISCPFMSFCPGPPLMAPWIIQSKPAHPYGAACFPAHGLCSHPTVNFLCMRLFGFSKHKTFSKSVGP